MISWSHCNDFSLQQIIDSSHSHSLFTSPMPSSLLKKTTINSLLNFIFRLKLLKNKQTEIFSSLCLESLSLFMFISLENRKITLNSFKWDPNMCSTWNWFIMNYALFDINYVLHVSLTVIHTIIGRSGNY